MAMNGLAEGVCVCFLSQYINVCWLTEMNRAATGERRIRIKGTITTSENLRSYSYDHVNI